MTDAEAETPILWLPDVKNRLIGKDHDAEKDWMREVKATIGNVIVGWVGDGQESLVYCSPWGCKELDTTEQLNWIELNHLDIN